MYRVTAILPNVSGGQLIREARKRALLTQAELARRLDSHQSVIARWETGRASPDFDAVRKALRAAGFELGVSLHPADEHDLAVVLPGRGADRDDREGRSAPVGSVRLGRAADDGRD